MRKIQRKGLKGLFVSEKNEDRLASTNFDPLIQLLVSDSGLVSSIIAQVGRADREDFSFCLTLVFESQGCALDLMKAAVAAEVAATENVSMLLRGNSIWAKTLSAYTKMVGLHYYRTTLTPVIKEALRTMPSRGMSTKTWQRDQSASPPASPGLGPGVADASPVPHVANPPVPELTDVETDAIDHPERAGPGSPPDIPSLPETALGGSALSTSPGPASSMLAQAATPPSSSPMAAVRDPSASPPPSPGLPPAGPPSTDVDLDWLQKTSEAFVRRILQSLDDFPLCLKQVCAWFKEEVVPKFGEAYKHAIGSFVFLRLLCPVIVAPHEFAVLKEEPAPAQFRNLLLISRVLQNLASGTRFAAKDPVLAALNPFIDEFYPIVEEFYRRLAEFRTDSESPIRIPPINTLPLSLLDDKQLCAAHLHYYISRMSIDSLHPSTDDTIPALRQILIDLGTPLTIRHRRRSTSLERPITSSATY